MYMHDENGQTFSSLRACLKDAYKRVSGNKNNLDYVFVWAKSSRPSDEERIVCHVHKGDVLAARAKQREELIIDKFNEEIFKPYRTVQ